MNTPVIAQQITFFRVRDLAVSAQFYEQVIGLELFLDQGSCRIYRVTGDSFVGFCTQKDAGELPRDGVIFTLVTPAVDEWYQHLQARGVEFEKAPALNPHYQIYHCFLRDPDGYLIEIQRFEDPRWQV